MVAKNNNKKVSKANKASGFEALEKHIGATLLAKADAPPKATKDVLKGMELVGVYFGAHWSEPCQTFLPTLKDFYSNCAKPNNMEIIYISSDNNKEEFTKAYSNMPWLAIDGDRAGTLLKHDLATQLKAYRLPQLAILDVQTGTYVTDQARKDILQLLVDDKSTVPADKGGELVKTWKIMNPIPIGNSSTIIASIQGFMDYFAKKPHMAAVLVGFLVFSPIVERVKDNPLLGVAFLLLYKLVTSEGLSRNMPYVAFEGNLAAEAKKNL